VIGETGGKSCFGTTLEYLRRSLQIFPLSSLGRSSNSSVSGSISIADPNVPPPSGRDGGLVWADALELVRGEGLFLACGLSGLFSLKMVESWSRSWKVVPPFMNPDVSRETCLLEKPLAIPEDGARLDIVRVDVGADEFFIQAEPQFEERSDIRCCPASAMLQLSRPLDGSRWLAFIRASVRFRGDGVRSIRNLG